jgi:protein-tyrosine phosphatase
MEQIIPYLYIGSESDFNEAVQKIKVDAVIDLRILQDNAYFINTERHYCERKNIAYYWCPFEFEQENSYFLLHDITSLINFLIGNRKTIFIHCDNDIYKAGIIACAYLVNFCDMLPIDAVNILLKGSDLDEE